MESLRQAPQPKEKFPSDSHKLDSESIMKAGLFMAHLQKEQSATIPKPIRETLQETAQRILSISEENFSKVRTLFYVEPQPKTRQEQIERLFGILKNGGSLGIHYVLNEGESKTPNQVLSSMKGDCNELALLFIASAKKLNIDTSDIGVAVLGFVVLGKERESLHAAALTIKGENYLLDLTHDSPEKLESVDLHGLSKAYANRRLATGDFVLRVGSMEIMSTPEEMVSVYFRDTASYYEIAATPEGKPISLPLLEKSISLREGALRLNPDSARLRYGLIRMHVEIADEYQERGFFESAEQHARKAVQYSVASPAQELPQEQKQKIAHAHGILGVAYGRRGEYQQSLDEFEQFVRLDPDNFSAYEGKAVAQNQLGSQHTSPEEKPIAKQRFLLAKDAIETALTKFIPTQKDRERLLKTKEIIEANLALVSQ